MTRKGKNFGGRRRKIYKKPELKEKIIEEPEIIQKPLKKKWPKLLGQSILILSAIVVIILAIPTIRRWVLPSKEKWNEDTRYRIM